MPVSAFDCSTLPGGNNSGNTAVVVSNVCNTLQKDKTTFLPTVTGDAHGDAESRVTSSPQGLAELTECYYDITADDRFVEDDQAILEWAQSKQRVDYTLITSDEELTDFVSSCSGWVALDVETTTLHPVDGRIRLVSITSEQGVVVVDADAADLKLIQPLFERCMVIGHNLSFDLRFLMAAGVRIPSRVRLADTMLAAQVIEASNSKHEKGHFTLEGCLSRYLNISMDKSMQKSDWSGELTSEQLEYAARDTLHLRELWDEMHQLLKESNLLQAAFIEMEALPAVAWMEMSGMPFDADEWKRQAEAEERKLQQIEVQMDDLAMQYTGRLGCNWRSGQQVIELLRLAGIDVSTFCEDELKVHADHPLVSKLLEYKRVQKLVSAFGSEFLLKHRIMRGRIYPSWQQLGASTGRMSCSNPNLQQIPRGERRQCFVAPEGRTLVIADYSQIELRIAAEIANDARMLEAFQDGVDLHTLTARLVLGKQEVTKEDRTAAKALNFGLLYGMGWRGLQRYAAAQYGVHLTDEQAFQFRERFFQTYTGLARWHEQTRSVVEGDETCEAWTLGGRRRVLHHVGDRPPLTDALNTPVQGAGADGLKATLALLWQERERFPSARLVMAVHDEVVMECDEADAPAVAEWLTDCMKRGMARFLHAVPVEVETHISKTWNT